MCLMIPLYGQMTDTDKEVTEQEQREIRQNLAQEKMNKQEEVDYKKEKDLVNLQIIKELLDSKDAFWWDIKTGSKNKGQLLLTLKSIKSNNDIPLERLQEGERIRSELETKVQNIPKIQSTITTSDLFNSNGSMG